MGCPQLQPWPELRLVPKAPEPLPFPAAPRERHCPQWPVIGNITDRYSFDAYGQMLGGHPNVTAPASTDMLYSGEQFDAELQWNYHRARYYDMSAGVWNRLDPFSDNHGDPQSLHKYAYCHGDPVNGVDPSGEFLLIELAVVMAIIILVVPGCAPVRRPGRINVVHPERDTIEDILTRFRNMPPSTLLRQVVDYGDQVQHRIRPLTGRLTAGGRQVTGPSYTEGRTTYYDPRPYILPTRAGTRTWSAAQALAHELLHRIWRDEGRDHEDHQDEDWRREERQITDEARRAMENY